MAADREIVLNALLAKIAAMNFATAVSGQTTWIKTSRRLELWGEVPSDQQPAAYLVERPEDDDWPRLGTVRRKLNVYLVAYARTDDRAVRGGTYLNTIVAALETALQPDDPSRNACTLGRLVYWCRIEGKILKEAGDIDNQAKLMVPITMELP